jgi:hypothetical protein
MDDLADGGLHEKGGAYTADAGDERVTLAALVVRIEERVPASVAARCGEGHGSRPAHEADHTYRITCGDRPAAGDADRGEDEVEEPVSEAT